MRKFILDELIKTRGLGIADVERMSGVPRSTVDAIRRNNGNGRKSNLDKLAESLELSYDELFRETDDKDDSRSNSDYFDNSDLLDIANEYLKEGNVKMHRRLTASAVKAGISVESILNRADAFYESGQYEDAVREYAYAFTSAKPRHISRIRKSAINFLTLFEDEYNFQPIIDLYRKVSQKAFVDYELLLRIGTFFAKNHFDNDLIIECFDAADEAAD